MVLRFALLVFHYKYYNIINLLYYTLNAVRSTLGLLANDKIIKDIMILKKEKE
jgi:ABC-type long-subunit fatty acid transport system fused permease/ATPase subunit